jgi:hypothetical protein
MPRLGRFQFLGGGFYSEDAKPSCAADLSSPARPTVLP